MASTPLLLPVRMLVFEVRALFRANQLGRKNRDSSLLNQPLIRTLCNATHLPDLAKVQVPRVSFV